MLKRLLFMMSMFMLLFILVGCAAKETSNEGVGMEDAETEESSAETVQNRGAAKDPGQQEIAPQQTKPKTELPNETKTGGEPAAPPSGIEREGHSDSASTPAASTEEDPSEPEEQQMMMLMDEYMANYPLAVNEGAFIYIMHLIDPTSVFYSVQADYVLDTYERNIKETLLDYEIIGITPAGEDEYQITVQESFGVYFGNEDREQVMDFENIYTVKKFEYGLFLIMDLQVTGLM